MFFEGDLRSGITTALAQQKLVACFVCDDEDESSEWESLLLQDSDIKEAAANRAVLLRLQYGSQEAGFLSAFCPVESAPCLMVIENGSLSENIKSGTSEEDFKTRLLQVLHPRKPPDINGDSSSNTNNTEQHVQNHPIAAEQTSEDSQPGLSSKAKGKQKATENTTDSETNNQAPQSNGAPDTRESTKDQRSTWVQEQKKRKEEAQQERKRILKQIENDRQERKEREQARKAAATEAQDSAESILTPLSNAKIPPKTPNSKECALKIRTFDGSTITSRFPSEHTLRQHIRPWIDAQLGKQSVPYDFTHVLAPMPNRKISVAEEEETLQSLGLAPSATLVMVPVQSYTEAYSADSQGYISRGLSFGYSVVKGGFSLAGSLASSVLGGGAQGGPAEERPHSVDGTLEAPRSNIAIRTLRDQRGASDDQQLYNGNTLNFEPRREDDDDDEKND